MKTFKDLTFKPHTMGIGVRGKMMFENGYGISVIRFKLAGDSSYGSYTDNEDEWEVAILKGTGEKWSMCYDTPITDDIIGHLEEAGVTKIMKEIQNLKS